MSQGNLFICVLLHSYCEVGGSGLDTAVWTMDTSSPLVGGNYQKGPEAVQSQRAMQPVAGNSLNCTHFGHEEPRESI